MLDDRLSVTFGALSYPTRRAILARLAKGEATVSELAKPFQLSQPAISKHLKVLENAGLVHGGRDAQRRPRTLMPEAIALVSDWLEPFREMWDRRFDNLEGYLSSSTIEEKK